jgi:quercetin dioxygenase-like cupin family protein
LKTLIENLKTLKPENLGLEKAEKVNKGIGIRNIFEKGGLRITLYYMPEGEIMKLHNHPSMLVITYILHGNLQAEMYTPQGDNMTFSKEKSNLNSGDVAFIDGMRTNDKNLHELTATENTYFIDILFPDYDEAKECLFFELDEEINDTTYKLKETDSQEVDFFEI